MHYRERQQYIAERLHTDWGWENHTKGPRGLSYRDMARRIWVADGRAGKPVSPATIKADIDMLREEAASLSDEELAEAEDLLAPEQFPKFRRKLRGDHYETPIFQKALFWVLYAITFKKAIPGWVIEYLDDLDPERPFPPDINDLIVEQKLMISFVFLLAPRHGKTDLLQDFVLWCHAKDPNRKVLFGNGTIKKTEQFIGNYFMPILEEHEWLIERYGPFWSGSKAWSKGGYVLKKRTGFHKANSMHPFGIDGSVLSLDSDLILADDISDLRRARSETTTEGDYDWLTTQLMTRREPETAFCYVGSHVAVNTGDLFEWIEDNFDRLNQGDHRLIIKKLPAHRYELCEHPEGSHDEHSNKEEDCNDPAHHPNCTIWPSRRGIGFLNAMKGLMADDAMYEAVYNQVSRSRAMTHFPKEVLKNDFILPDPDPDTKIRPSFSRDLEESGVLDRSRSWKNDRHVCCRRPILVAMGFDPAAGETKSSSMTAWTVLGVCSDCGRRYVIDYDALRQSPEEHPLTIIEVLKAFPAIKRLRIEINAYQKALAREPRLGNIFHEHGVWIDEWNTDERKNDPDLGIPNMGRYFKSMNWSIPAKTLGDVDYGDAMVKSFARWPKRPNDIPMSAWLADLSLMELIEETRHEGVSVMPGTEGQMTEAHDENSFTVDLSDPDLWRGTEYATL